MKKSGIFFALLLINASYVVSNDRAWDIPEPRSFTEALIPGIIAGGEILLYNGTFTFVNWLNRQPWAVPSRESVRRNLTSAWQWEDYDGFLVNQFGHPFQGSLAYNAGRANGFGFYQNIFFSAFGSATWEVFFERNQASINDFYTTVPGSLAAGEISYRLYAEAHAAGIPAPLAFLLSPAAGLHNLLNGLGPPNAARNLHELRLFFGGAYAQTRSSISGGQEEKFSFDGPYVYAGFKSVYGNPFEQDTRVPYRHFEFAASYGINPGRFHDLRLISDGYLFSFSPVYSDTAAISTGLTLHMDFTARGWSSMRDSTINHYSNALNWTIKYQQLFLQSAAMQIKAHAGLTFMGASKFFSPETGGEDNNFGYGLNSKLFFNLSGNRLGRLEVDLLGYVMWSYPGTSAPSSGTVYWLFSDITYSRFVSQHVSIGTAGSLAREWGQFGGFPDTIKRNDSIKLFVAWNI